MFQDILSKMTNYNLEIFQSILSFFNAVFCIYFMYKYKKTKDVNFFKTGALYFFFPFLIIDLFLNIYLIRNNSEKKTCLEAIYHHIITFCLSIWLYLIGLDTIPDITYIFTLFESSTIFLNIRYWFKEYMNAMEGKNVPIFMTILQNINELVFSILFIYFRCYVFLKDIIFNKSFYDRLLSSGNFINKLFILGIFVFLILNIYWSYMVCKSGYKKINNIVIDQFKNNYLDDEIVLIEKIKSEIINSRLNEKC
jgi:hypothetical protein